MTPPCKENYYLIFFLHLFYHNFNYSSCPDDLRMGQHQPCLTKENEFCLKVQ
jgi:hypothetical protein